MIQCRILYVFCGSYVEQELVVCRERPVFLTNDGFKLVGNCSQALHCYEYLVAVYLSLLCIVGYALCLYDSGVQCVDLLVQGYSQRISVLAISLVVSASMLMILE